MQRQKQSKSGQGLKKKNLPPIWIPVPCLSLQNSGGYNIPLSAPSHSSTRMVNVKNWNIKWTERQLLDLFYELPFRNMLVTIQRSPTKIRRNGCFHDWLSYTRANKL